MQLAEKWLQTVPPSFKRGYYCANALSGKMTCGSQNFEGETPVEMAPIKHTFGTEHCPGWPDYTTSRRYCGNIVFNPNKKINQNIFIFFNIAQVFALRRE